MLNKNLLLKVSSLLVVGLMFASPAFAKSPKDTHKEGRLEDSTEQSAIYGTGNSGPLTLPASGMASVVFINYDGGSEQLLMDFNGIDYVVPPSVNGIPSQLEISLAPGTYSYTASVAGVGDVTRSIDLAAGTVTGLGFYDVNPDLHTHHSSSQVQFLNDFDTLKLTVTDMTAQAQ